MKDVVGITEEYERALNNNKLVGSKCDQCGNESVPPRSLCRKCGSIDYEIKEVEPEGNLLSWTKIIIAPPEYVGEAPYYLGLVELDENSESLMGILNLPQDESLVVGMKMTGLFMEGFEGPRRFRWGITKL